MKTVAIIALGLAAVGAVIVLGAQTAPQIGLIAPLPAAVPAASYDVAEKTIVDLLAAQRIGSVTSRDLVEKYLARIRAYDQNGPRLNAVVALNPRALEEADALDGERRAGRVRGPLHGIPIVVSDNYATADMPTTAAPLALAGFETGRDAFVIRRLIDGGAVILGKTNRPDFTNEITPTAAIEGRTRSPFNSMRADGSSGGTAAAVAASFAAAGMATDTCGGIRNGAAQNSLWALRGTAGLSSRDGILPLSHSQDIGGPLARSVSDLLLMLDHSVGFDPADETTRASDGNVPRTYNQSVGDAGLGDVTIGVLAPLFGSSPEDDEVSRIVRDATEDIRSLGAGLVEAPFAGLGDVMADTSMIEAELESDLQHFLQQYPAAPVHSLGDLLSRGRYEPELAAALGRAHEAALSPSGPLAGSQPYRAALARREQARQAVLDAMSARGITAFVYPTLRRHPGPAGRMRIESNCQLSATTGLPAISMPAGVTSGGEPVGMELLGRAWSEPKLLKIAYAYERLVAPRRPPSTVPPLTVPPPVPPLTVSPSASPRPPGGR